MSDDDLDFEPEQRDPPAKQRRRRIDWAPRLEKLKKLKKGSWYVLGRWYNATSANQYATNLRKRFKEFDFADGGTDDGGSELFARVKTGKEAKKPNQRDSDSVVVSGHLARK